jgi:hypothetical protein
VTCPIRSAKAKEAWARRRQRNDRCDELNTLLKMFDLNFVTGYADRERRMSKQEFNDYRYRLYGMGPAISMEYFHTLEDLTRRVNVLIGEVSGVRV